MTEPTRQEELIDDLRELAADAEADAIHLRGDAWSSWAADVARRAITALAPVEGADASGVPHFSVSELRAGEANDGEHESSDLFLQGRGISLLVNIEQGSRATYSLIVDGLDKQSGTVEVKAGADAAPATIDNGNIYVFCDAVNHGNMGCVRGAGHNGPHAFVLPPYPQTPVLLVDLSARALGPQAQGWIDE